ncbi:hypothetical protein C2E23DRAFT_560537 [Lenzites betulinus]|nr:hypothetical protein C2E23DRAFT_560537 [Lenzites betulinus]
MTAVVACESWRGVLCFVGGEAASTLDSEGRCVRVISFDVGQRWNIGIPGYPSNPTHEERAQVMRAQRRNAAQHALDQPNIRHAVLDRTTLNVSLLLTSHFSRPQQQHSLRHYALSPASPAADAPSPARSEGSRTHEEGWGASRCSQPAGAGHQCGTNCSQSLGTRRINAGAARCRIRVRRAASCMGERPARGMARTTHSVRLLCALTYQATFSGRSTTASTCSSREGLPLDACPAERGTTSLGGQRYCAWTSTGGNAWTIRPGVCWTLTS